MSSTNLVLKQYYEINLRSVTPSEFYVLALKNKFLLSFEQERCSFWQSFFNLLCTIFIYVHSKLFHQTSIRTNSILFRDVINKLFKQNVVCTTSHKTKISKYPFRDLSLRRVTLLSEQL